MILFLISILAGALTILAPCIFPLLPVVVGSSDAGKSSAKTFRVILSLAFSVFIFTILLKASTLFIDIPETFWQYFSGLIIIFLGFSILFPSIWANLPFVKILNLSANKRLGEGYKKNNSYGDVLIGFSLGPVFTTCSPTYFFILGTVLPKSINEGLLYLLGFILGLTLALFLVAYLGNKVINIFAKNENTLEKVKKVFAILFILTGIFIITGYDKKFATYLLDRGFAENTVNFEENLIKNFK